MNDESRKALPAHRSSFRIHRSSLVSPISSGGNFGGLRLGRACSDPGGAPGVSGSVSPRTCLRRGFWQVYVVVGGLCRTVVGLSNGDCPGIIAGTLSALVCQHVALPEVAA